MEQGVRRAVADVQQSVGDDAGPQVVNNRGSGKTSGGPRTPAGVTAADGENALFLR